jgi:sulfonate transport system permease protein
MTSIDTTTPVTASASLLTARLRGARPAVLGMLLLLAAWQLAAIVMVDRHVVPGPATVAAQLWQDRSSILANSQVTLREAMTGYLWGNLTAIVFGVLFVQFRAVERLLLRLAIASYCVPLVAIAPILVVVLDGDGPKSALAALSVFFTTLIATMIGLRSSDPTALEVVRASGGTTWDALRYVRVRAALPAVLAGLCVAAPAALLGAIIGEYLGASEGLGVALVQAQSSFEVARTWALAVAMSLLAGLLYALTAAVARKLTPWSTSVQTVGSAPQVKPSSGPGWARAAGSAAFATASIAVIIGLWYGALAVLRLDPYFAKSPTDVWSYLFSGADARAGRAELLDALGVTLMDAGVGYLVGSLIAVLAAVLIVSLPGVERVVTPVAIVLRSVPIVAMTPLLALVFGRQLLGVTVIVSLVVFFPTLVNMVVGLRSAPAVASDVVAAAGGHALQTIRLVRLPYALPALFASARIAVPAALGGATLAEWLATGQGMGSLLVVSYSNSQFAKLWSGSVLIVAASVTLYALVAALEAPVLRRFAHPAG